jgi:imidazolonepropionase-like amidohydrolase
MNRGPTATTPSRQRELADLLVTAIEEVIQHLPGFIAANIHVSVDGARVANYAQWETVEALQAMLENSDAKERIDRSAEIAESFDPGLYNVVSVHHR